MYIFCVQNHVDLADNVTYRSQRKAETNKNECGEMELSTGITAGHWEQLQALFAITATAVGRYEAQLTR
jgi:hypothetical protein